MTCKKVSYGKKLDQYVKSNNYIPYRLHPNARYRNNCYYWSNYDDMQFKVEEVQYDFYTSPKPILDHVIIRYQDGFRAWSCTDLSILDFRLEKDKYDIKDKDIINSKLSFSGGEIEYWFFIHDIQFYDKYKGFWKYIDPNSESRIDPNKFYFIVAEERYGNFVGIKFILDTTQEKFKKKKEDRPKLLEESIKEEKPVDNKKDKKRRKKKYGANSKKKPRNSHRRRR